MTHLPPLEPCHGCGHLGCDYAKEGEPCWGETWLAWETPTGDLHACEGHEEAATITGGTYRHPGDPEWWQR